MNHKHTDFHCYECCQICYNIATILVNPRYEKCIWKDYPSGSTDMFVNLLCLGTTCKCSWTTWFLPLTISALFMHFKKPLQIVFFILIPGSPFPFLSCKRLKMFIFSQFQDVQIQIYTFICTWKHGTKYPGSPVDTYQVSLEQLVNVTNKASCVYLPITRSVCLSVGWSVGLSVKML